MKIKITKKSFKNMLILVLGNLLLAFAVSFCFINYHGYHYYGENNQNVIEINGILAGGTSSFSLILRNLFKIPSGHLETIITVVTWFLFIIGFIFLGKKFAVQTLVSTVLYPIFLYIFKISIFDGLRESFNQFDPIICSVIGGLIMGTGCGIIYRIGGSTGGFDIPGLIINKYTRIKLSRIFLLTDGILVALSLIAHFTLYEVVIGLLAVIAYSYAVGVTQLQGTRSYICEIISDKWEDINREILALDRGTTIIDVTGGYTGEKRKMIKTMVGKNQYLAILDIVNKYDDHAFISMEQTNDIFGEGFRDQKNFSNK